ncbi:MAG: hypothetical protein M3483_07275, partial [Gemmatimonadota bacterium]|nr:hypothetical protein [Gemmatimonadota bacterium]
PRRLAARCSSGSSGADNRCARRHDRTFHRTSTAGIYSSPRVSAMISSVVNAVVARPRMCSTSAQARLRPPAALRMAVHVQLATIGRWKEMGIHLQLNTGSLLGRYGDTARRAATELLRLGWADYLSSDYHGRGPLRMRECRELLLKRGGQRQAELLLAKNARRLLKNEPPLPVPPIDLSRSLWNAVRDWRPW